MAIPEKQKKYNAKNIRRVPLDMQKDYFENILKPAADSAGMAVNAFIKQAIAEKIEREKNNAF